MTSRRTSYQVLFFTGTSHKAFIEAMRTALIGGNAILEDRALHLDLKTPADLVPGLSAQTIDELYGALIENSDIVVIALGRRIRRQCGAVLRDDLGRVLGRQTAGDVLLR